MTGYTVRQPFFMSYKDVTSYKNLLTSGEKCCNGGRWKPSIQAHEMMLLRNTSRLKQKLDNNTFKPRKTNNFTLRERGKWREIKAHCIADRQIYKSFCKHELKPSIQSLLLPNNSASQIGKGTEYAIKQFRQALAKAVRKWGKDFYVITFDFRDYFGSILHKYIGDVISLSDEKSILLLKQYVNIFPTRKGIGIGGEPSQDISVAYPSKLDRMLACESCVLDSGRYMDDGYVICHTKEEAVDTLDKIRKVTTQLGLEINEKRTKISYMKKDSVVWLKKRTYISDSGKIIMRLTRKNIRDEIRRIKFQKKMIDRGGMPREVADISMQCWCAYANKYNSRRAVLKVVNFYMETFDVPWEVAKNLFKKHNTNPKGGNNK